ncbi:hypothetical protein SeMB42_g05235 [Synchytrium endobioticum]|uniref:Ferric oxidoreductase domain-containing protein n=1 Tax=Synchytrium endobioticum TaxID=286115 RepID=A0A507CSR6_9FUNG|nr:hypothetical protein SeMB42_g05235 [Synchytrium endobioticum]
MSLISHATCLGISAQSILNCERARGLSNTLNFMSGFKELRWTVWASLFAFLLGYVLPLCLSNAPCYASHCTGAAYLVTTTWVLFGIFCVLTLSAVAVHKRYSSRKLTHFLGQRVFARLDVCVGEVTVYIAALVLCAITFVLWYTWRLAMLADSPLRHWASAFIASAHMCDVALGLTMLPVSRSSFIVAGVGISTSTALRFHKMSANLLIASALVHGIVVRGAITGLLGRSVAQCYTVVLGVGSLGLLATLYIASLPPMRRRIYALFIGTHPGLAVAVVAGSALHASSNAHYALPGLLVYAVELLDRVHMWMQPYEVARARIEKCGSIRLDVSTTHAWRATQWCHLYVPAISPLGHPFTAARVTDTATFVIKPQNRFTKRVWETVLKGTTDLQLKMSAPHGCVGYPLHMVATLACFASGSGITGALSMVYGWLEACRGTVYLFWVSPSHAHHEMSVVQELMWSRDVRVCMVLYAGRQNPASIVGLDEEKYADILKMPFDAVALLDKVVTPSLAPEEALGGFVCGSKVFGKIVQDAMGEVSARKKIISFMHTEPFGF